jgi:diguanylate cyclase (GGDEF)-like protein/PAS domain S-box-containing protein
MSLKRGIFRKYRLVWLVSLLGGLYYIFDAYVASNLLGKGSFSEQLLHPEPFELWWRLNVLVISLLFGIYAQHLLHRAEAAARQANTAEKFLNSIIENTPLMVFIKDGKSLRYVKVNKEAENLTGYSRETLVGKSDFDLFPENQANFFSYKDRQALKNKIPLDIPEEEIDIESRGTRTLHTRKVPILDDNGNAVFLLCISEDITERLDAQNELIKEKKCAERYLQISEAIIVGIDINGCINVINRRGCGVLRRSHDGLVGKNWFDVAIPEAERETVRSLFTTMLMDGNEFVEYYENEIVAADGVRYFIAWHNTIQKSSTGEIEGILSSGIDITERKIMENQLRMAGAVYESTNQSVVVTDKNNNIISVNPAFTTITGYEPDEVIGKNPYHIKSDQHDKGFYEKLWEEIGCTGHWEGEIWDRRKNGEAFPSWHTISSIVNDNGEITSYVSVFSDITPIKQHQESLNFLAHHDPLTGLPNRLMINDRIEHAFQRCVRQSSRLALMFLDLDDFKYINDTYGHSVGDQVLKLSANRLKSLLRKEDTVARLGGDEFLILFESNISDADIEQVAKKIIKDVTASMLIDGRQLAVGISVGIAIGPAGARDSQSLIEAADQAMYRAKNNTGNSYSF